MSLAAALQPLLSLDGLVAVLVMTPDGLPVEMLGHGPRADRAAAELAALTKVATRSCQELHLGAVKQVTVELSQHELLLYPLANHYLAVIVQTPSKRSLVSALVDSVWQDLTELLGDAA